MDDESGQNGDVTIGVPSEGASDSGRMILHIRSILAAISSEANPAALMERLMMSLRSILRFQNAVLWYEDHESIGAGTRWKSHLVGADPERCQKTLDEEFKPLFVEENLLFPNAYLLRADGVPSNFTSDDGPHITWRTGDLFGIMVVGRHERPIARFVIDGEDGTRMPQRADIEMAQVLLQIFGLELDRSHERMTIVRDSDRMVRRSDLLEDILNIASTIVSERDLKAVSDKVLTSVASLFGFQRVTLVAYDEGLTAFRWVAIYGYPEQMVKATLMRTIPIDIILEDLRETRRIGRSTYFIPMEDLPRKSLEYFVDPTNLKVHEGIRVEGEFREGDSLPFALYDSSGRISGVIYPSAPKDGRIPDRDTIEMIEVFASLVEVAIENARLSNEKEVALRLSSLRTEQMSRIFDITSKIMYIRDLDEMLDDVLATLAHLLGMKRMVLALRNEDGQQFDVKSVHGYDERRSDEIKKISYSSDSIEAISNLERHRSLDPSVLWCKKVGQMTYYIPAESIRLESSDMIYYPEPDLLKLPRKSKEHWHELDYLDTLIHNSQGKVVAYLEILKPRDDRIPDRETIEIIEIFASLVGIALENAHMVQGHIVSRRNAEFYTDLLSHDIKNFNQAILGYLDILRSMIVSPEQSVYIDKIIDQVMNINKLSADVRTMSRLTWGSMKLVKTDLGRVLLDSIQSVQQYNLMREIIFRHDIRLGQYYVMADELIHELFVNILTNAVKYDSNAPVALDISLECNMTDDDARVIVSVADRGRGVPDDLKQEIFQRFSRAPKKKGSGLGLYLVMTLTSKYGGRVWVEDRVPGDYSKGAVFRVELPIIIDQDAHR